MKRMLSLVLLLALLLCGCGGGGIVKDTALIIGPSALYGGGEVKAAMNVVMDAFKNMDGCTLRELSYDEELNLKQRDEWAEQYHADEAIVIGSVFDVPMAGGPVTLDPGSTHTWKWVLTRSRGGSWELQTWGYA